MESPQNNNKVYLTTEAHRRAYYKFDNNHKKELFDKIKFKYAHDKELKKKKKWIVINNIMKEIKYS